MSNLVSYHVKLSKTLNDLENLEIQSHLVTCKDVKIGYNYSCHHGYNDDLSNHIASLWFHVGFAVDEYREPEMNRL